MNFVNDCLQYMLNLLFDQFGQFIDLWIIHRPQFVDHVIVLNEFPDRAIEVVGALIFWGAQLGNQINTKSIHTKSAQLRQPYCHTSPSSPPTNS